MAHEFPIRIYYEDTDLAGIVYYANYLKFMERARSEAVRSVEIDQGQLRDQHDLVFAVRRADVQFHAPARLDNVVTVRSVVTRLGGASLEMHQAVWRGDTLLTEGDIRIAAMSSAGKPLRLPADIREKLARLPRS